MAEPKIDRNASISKNLKIIYGKELNINTEQKAKMAEALLKFAEPKEKEDPIRLYMLKQSLSNYYAVGESAYLLHCVKKAYHYIKDNGQNLYAQLISNFNNSPQSDIAQKVK